jgi:hypothetical protein
VDNKGRGKRQGEGEGVEGLERTIVTTKHFYCGLFKLFKVMVTFKAFLAFCVSRSAV